MTLTVARETAREKIVEPRDKGFAFVLSLRLLLDTTQGKTSSWPLSGNDVRLEISWGSAPCVHQELGWFCSGKWEKVQRGRPAGESTGDRLQLPVLMHCKKWGDCKGDKGGAKGEECGK